MRHCLCRCPAVTGLLLTLVCPGPVLAQAWLPTKGEGAIGITFGNYAFDGHFASDGRRDPFGGTTALSAAGDIIYGITDRLAVTGSLPFITSKLTGSFPKGVALGPLDDGKYHGDFQDFRFEVRFMAVPGILAVTPFAGINLPSHDYEVIGEAVAGKGTKEASLGVASGRSLEPFLPRAYVHGRYSYTFVERVVPDVKKLDRSNFDAEIGYSVSGPLTMRAFGAWQITHGGLNLEDMRTRPGFFRTHDRAARTNYFNLGTGATLQVTRSVEVFAVFVKTISGENAHQARSFYLGASLWFGGNFGTKRSVPLSAVHNAPPRLRACPLC